MSSSILQSDAATIDRLVRVDTSLAAANGQPAPAAVAPGWQTIGGAAHSLAVYADRLAALSPDRAAVWSRDPATGQWTMIGGPATGLISGGWDLYAVSPDLWRFDGRTWTHVSGPAAQFVAIGTSVYALSSDRSAVSRYDRYSGQWTKIGGPADRLIGGGSKLYAVEPGGGAIHEYSRYERTWTRIGGPGAEWVGVGGTVFGLTSDRSAVFRYEGTPDVWTQVGDPAATLIGGGSVLYAIQPGSGAVWRYTGSGQSWVQVGPAGTGFVATGRTLYGLNPDRSAALELDTASAESRRLRTLMYKSYDAPRFEGRMRRGFLVKRMNGATIAEHNADVIYQPLSTLKLLGYLHALVEVDKGLATLNTHVSWTEFVTGDDTENKCLAPGTPDTRTGSAPLRDALPTMMWFSHNRTLEAILNRYGPVNVTRAAQKRGQRQTEMYHGCGDGSPFGWWAHNMTTLTDVARMFEGVENLASVTKPATRELFRHNMIEITPAPGSGYSSPINNQNTAGWNNEYLRPLVQREAGPAKQAIVSEFMKHVVVRGKAGGGWPTPDEAGYCDFLEVTLPHKQNGAVVLKKYLIGWYLNQLHEGIQASTGDPDHEVFTSELYTVPIRESVKTW